MHEVERAFKPPLHDEVDGGRIDPERLGRKVASLIYQAKGADVPAGLEAAFGERAVAQARRKLRRKKR